jgi:hypothetical protein
MAALKRLSTDASSALDFFAITPSDVTNFTNNIVGIYVGGAGTVVAVTENDAAISFVGALAGTVLPIKCKRVNSTSTTATNLVGLY